MLTLPPSRCLLILALFLTPLATQAAEMTRLLRQPALCADQVAFVYGGDIWLVDRAGGQARRVTSTPAVETDPHFSPDGRWLAYTSNRAGKRAVYVQPVNGGSPQRLTWYPADASARGWTPKGDRVLYASSRETAPISYYNRLWTVSPEGGPSELLPAPFGHDGSYSPDGEHLVIDGSSRWDREWRNYRGGQNTPLTVLGLKQLDEVRLPHKRTTDVHPVWLDQAIYFLSDRDGIVNVWSFVPATAQLAQLTEFKDVDIKWLGGHETTLIFEHDGYLQTLDITSRKVERLEISVIGDFPWAEAGWETVDSSIISASLSPTGKRALFEARGEVFTVPVEHGSLRNLTQSDGAADRSPVWSPKGQRVAWFSDSGGGYELLIGAQDGLQKPRRLDIGESKMAWEPTWSPDGARIAFVDDDVRIRIVEVESGKVTTADVGGTNIERGKMGLTWSPDSKWLAYAKTFHNSLRRIVVWSTDSEKPRALTGPMGDAAGPSWSRDGKLLHFLASTDVALGSGWANTSGMGAAPEYGVYTLVLSADEATPFEPESDEEPPQEEKEAEPAGDEDEKDDEGESDEEVEVSLDFDAIERRIVAIPMPVARYAQTLAGPEGTIFISEATAGGDGMILHKFSFEDREAEVFAEEVTHPSVSADGEQLLYQAGGRWTVIGTGAPPEPGKGQLDVALRMRLDPRNEWRQIFDEAWRYQRDFFYDPGMHGGDWERVRQRYTPLLSWVRHRTDLHYLIDQMNGELSVGHSFVWGGDFPDVERSPGGVLGVDLIAHRDRWQIERIYTFESWNPELRAPLDRPGLKVATGQYLIAVDGVEMTTQDDPYRLLEGTAGRQTVLHLNTKPTMDDAWTATVVPQESESDLRQRAWIEDNRRRVEKLSDGKLAYVWVPNTGGRGLTSFNRYFFAQQDKLGAVIDERFNGGGMLDDYMVDLMTRSLRAAITNEVPGGSPMRLPAGILGPKVLLINELAGSGGDFFPWVFRRLEIGPLIGKRTWGGLVKSSVHYSMVDGGKLTAPDNAVFDPIANEWIAENEGIAPDIEVWMTAGAVAEGRDPQLERGVTEALRLLSENPPPSVVPPPFPTPARAR